MVVLVNTVVSGEIMVEVVVKMGGCGFGGND